MTVSIRNVPGNETAAVIANDLWFRRQVERLHRLGPRVTAEFLVEIGAERGIQTIIEDSLGDTVTAIPPQPSKSKS